jgi:hypothetical protein
MSNSQSLLSWIGSRFFFSFLSAITGWIAGVLLLGCIALMTFVSNGQASQISFPYMSDVATAMGILVFFGWGCCLLPFWFLAVRPSKLWKPLVLTVSGALTGFLLMFSVFLLLSYNDPEGDFSLYDCTLSGALFCSFTPMLIGGVAGYTSVLLNKHYMQKEAA